MLGPLLAEAPEGLGLALEASVPCKPLIQLPGSSRVSSGHQKKCLFPVQGEVTIMGSHEDVNSFCSTRAYQGLRIP